MKVGELLIGLGVKLDEKAKGSLSELDKAVSKLGSSGLATKAALFGIGYAVQRFTQHSAEMGTSLLNFQALTGGSMKVLQQWEHGLRQTGLSTEEAQGQFEAFQKVMSQLALGKPPEGLVQISLALKKAGMNMDIDRMKTDMPYLMGLLREYAKLTANTPGIGNANAWLESFGAMKGFIAGSRRGKFDEKELAKAPLYTDREARDLDKINIAWKNIYKTIEMSMGKLNAKHGQSLVKDISILIPKIMALGDSLLTLAERLKVFEAFGTVLRWIGQIADTIPDFMKWANTPLFKEADRLKDIQKQMDAKLKERYPGLSDKLDASKDRNARPIDNVIPFNKAFHAPMALKYQRQPFPVQQTTINQNNTIYGVENDKDVINGINRGARQAVEKAYRPNPAQLQSN